MHKTDATTFPDVLEDLPTATLLQAYAEGPRRIRDALAGLTDGQLTAHPIPGKWSIAEIVFHLADAEIMGAARVRQAVAESGAVAAVYDQDCWADGLRYGTRDRAALDEALDLFELLRRTTTPLFREGGGSRTVMHAGWGGQITLRQLLELYADHSERHLAQILERRRLQGVPLAMEPLVADRLY